MYNLREIEHRGIPEINKWHNDKELSRNFWGGYKVYQFRGRLRMV